MSRNAILLAAVLVVALAPPRAGAVPDYRGEEIAFVGHWAKHGVLVACLRESVVESEESGEDLAIHWRVLPLDFDVLTSRTPDGDVETSKVETSKGRGGEVTAPRGIGEALRQDLAGLRSALDQLGDGMLQDQVGHGAGAVFTRVVISAVIAALAAKRKGGWPVGQPPDHPSRGDWI